MAYPENALTAIERDICDRIIKEVLADNYRISVYDGEDWRLMKSDDYEAITAAMCSTGYDILKVVDSGRVVGDVILIYGNGIDIIYDHTCNEIMARYCREWEEPEPPAWVLPALAEIRVDATAIDNEMVLRRAVNKILVAQAAELAKAGSPVECPCTMIEQSEDCPIGYPSMVCGVCSGTGVTTREKVNQLAAEMTRIASEVGEPHDPFAAWESLRTLDDLKAQRDSDNKVFRDTTDSMICTARFAPLASTTDPLKSRRDLAKALEEIRDAALQPVLAKGQTNV